MATATRGVRNARPSGRARHEQLQQLLERQQRVLRTRMEALRQSAPTEMSVVKDVEERSLDLMELSVGLVALELSSRAAQGIETALRRIDAGQYGICSECGDRIPGARLRAVPFAARCLGCQERSDDAPMMSSRL